MQLAGRTRDLALVNLAVDSKLRGYDPVRLGVGDVAPRGFAADPTTIRQRKTGRPVRFGITEQTHQVIDDLRAAKCGTSDHHLFAGRRGPDHHLSTRQHGRLLSEWNAGIGLDPSLFGTHSIRCTKVKLIYNRTGNFGAVRLPLGHTKIESTVRFLGVALAISVLLSLHQYRVGQFRGASSINIKYLPHICHRS